MLYFLEAGETVEIAFGRVASDVLNFVPPQGAGQVAQAAGRPTSMVAGARSTFSVTYQKCCPIYMCLATPSMPPCANRPTWAPPGQDLREAVVSLMQATGT